MEDFKYYTERKILKDKIQQDGKMPTCPSQELNLGLQQIRLVLCRLSYWDRAEMQPEHVTSQPSCFYPPAPSDPHKVVHGFGLSHFLSEA